MVTWVEAVKEYAKKSGKFVIPKKDSEEYKAVRALQEKMSKAPLPKQEVAKEEKPKRSRKAVVTAEEKTPVEAVAPVKQKKVAVESKQVESPIEPKEKKQRVKKVVVPEEPLKNEVVAEAPVKEKKPRKTALRGEPRVTIEDKKVILNFD